MFQKKSLPSSAPANFPKSAVVGLICTLLIVSAIVFHFNKVIIYSPNSYLFGASGDAIKSYFSTLSLIKENTSLHQLGLMNYPYGQTYIYTDGQTSIAWTIRALGILSPWFTYNAIGLINSFYLVNWLFCAIFLYLIFLRLRLPWYFCIPGAIVITLLSPQLFRVASHPTLSYVMFFPLSWWLLLRFSETKNKFSWAILLIINCLFWHFVHPYYLPAITFFYILAFFVGYLQRKISRKDLLTWGLPISIIPILISLIYLSFYDHHIGRSAYPYGFWAYHSNIFSIFLPSHPPLLNVFQYFYDYTSKQIWEGWAYIGFSCVLIFIYCLIKVVRYIAKRKYHRILNPVYPEILSIAIWPALLLLAYSMCFPFKYGFSFLYDYVGPFRQFRALGRFAWVFYYVFTVFAVYTFYLMYRYLAMRKLKLLSGTLYLCFFATLFAEGYADQKEVSRTILRNPNFFKMSLLTDEQTDLINKVQSIKYNYQAIITLPFYHVGSESYSKEFTDKAITSSLLFSYWTDLPLVNSSSARSPIPEARKIMQLPSPPYINKEIVGDLPNKKGFLVLFTKEDLNNQERLFYTRCKPIYETAKFQLLEISYSDLTEQKVDFRSVTANKNCLAKKPDFIVDGDSTNFIFESFEKSQSEFMMEGKGAFQGIKKDNNRILTDFSLNALKGSNFIVSFWYYNKGELRLQNTCIVEQHDQQGTNLEWLKKSPISESFIINGDWSLVEMEFQTTIDNPKISVVLSDFGSSTQKIYIDNLLLRRRDSHIYRIATLSNSQKISFDNSPLE